MVTLTTPAIETRQRMIRTDRRDPRLDAFFGPPPAVATQKRVLLFAHDGGGLGHLRRMARIASALQGPCAALVVTGLREGAWIVPETCELLHLPGWNSLRAKRAKYWGRAAWLDIDEPAARRMRSEWLAAAFRAFAPDAVLVDYLPFGKADELVEALQASCARKYFVLRGIIDSSDRDVLCGDAARRIGDAYDRILVAADPRIVDVVEQCAFDPQTAAKVALVGYVAPPPGDPAAARRARGLADGQSWVVCSGGGGMHAEKFLHHCVDVAARMPDVAFDVVFGPRSNENLARRTIAPANCRVTRRCLTLPEWHAAADVVVTSGGYNSMLEAAVGGARILVFPSHTGAED